MMQRLLIVLVFGLVMLVTSGCATRTVYYRDNGYSVESITVTTYQRPYVKRYYYRAYPYYHTHYYYYDDYAE